MQHFPCDLLGVLGMFLTRINQTRPLAGRPREKKILTRPLAGLPREKKILTRPLAGRRREKNPDTFLAASCSPTRIVLGFLFREKS